MSLMNVGVSALNANQQALTTVGHNIANVNTPGYSRQTVYTKALVGQNMGNGFIGKGVQVATVMRNYSALLNRQSNVANATYAADSSRLQGLMQMQDVFKGGDGSLGAAVTNMMNAFVDVQAAPSDATGRNVVLTRMSELAARFHAASNMLEEQDYSTAQQLRNNALLVNDKASQVARLNNEISRALATGHQPNDLLDARDQVIREINQYVQTTQVAADDGTISLFVGGSQALVLGNQAASVSVAESQLFTGSNQMRLFFNRPGATPSEMQEDMLGGGEMAGLLKFANNDLVEGRNLLGRMALAIGMSMNAQNKLGLTLDGKVGGDLFTVPAGAKGYTSSAGLAGSNVSYADPTRFAASDYEVRFTGANAGQVVRLSDGKTTGFTSLTDPSLQNIDGLTFNLTGAGAAGERILFKPFADAAANIKALVNSPRDLAAANPINAAMGTSNGGTLQLSELKATGLPNPPGLVLPPNGDTATPPAFPGGIQLQFTAGPPATYDVINRGSAPPTTVATGQSYVAGQPISINGWSITLQGTPKSGDTVNIGNATDPQYGDYYTRNAGNASALMALRDVKMFDESKLSDGYAGLMAQIGTRTQSASYAAELSNSIASNLEADRTAVSGVNLDEEAARLIQYQQAYQASAKMLQIAQNIFDNLIQSMGR